MLVKPGMMKNTAPYQIHNTRSSVRVRGKNQAGSKKIAAIKTHPSVVPASDLAKAALPELQADWLTAIEKGWAANVGN